MGSLYVIASRNDILSPSSRSTVNRMLAPRELTSERNSSKVSPFRQIKSMSSTYLRQSGGSLVIVGRDLLSKYLNQSLCSIIVEVLCDILSLNVQILFYALFQTCAGF